MHATAEDHRDEVVFPGDGEPGGAQADIARRERAGLARLQTEVVGDITLATDYWDCECVENYIHPKDQAQCTRCWAKADDQPDSRLNEVEGMLADMREREAQARH